MHMTMPNNRSTYYACNPSLSHLRKSFSFLCRSFYILEGGSSPAIVRYTFNQTSAMKVSTVISSGIQSPGGMAVNTYGKLNVLVILHVCAWIQIVVNIINVL